MSAPIVLAYAQARFTGLAGRPFRRGHTHTYTHRGQGDEGRKDDPSPYTPRITRPKTNQP